MTKCIKHVEVKVFHLPQVIIENKTKTGRVEMLVLHMPSGARNNVLEAVCAISAAAICHSRGGGVDLLVET